MKKFKFKSKKNKFEYYYILLIIAEVFVFLNMFNQKISTKLYEIAYEKLEEITTLYIKKDIIPNNINLDRLISTTQNDKEEIMMMDIDTNYANELMTSVLSKIQQNILNLEQGNIDELKNKQELESYNNNVYIKIPILLYRNGMLAGLGAKIPVKINFYEHVLGDIDSKIESYGINNASLKVYLNVELTQKITIPYIEKKIVKNYKLVLGNKIIQGKIPAYYGSYITQQSHIKEL